MFEAQPVVRRRARLRAVTVMAVRRIIEGVLLVAYAAAIGNLRAGYADNLVELVVNILCIAAIRVGYACHVAECIIFVCRGQTEIVRIDDRLLQVTVVRVGRVGVVCSLIATTSSGAIS